MSNEARHGRRPGAQATVGGGRRLREVCLLASEQPADVDAFVEELVRAGFEHDVALFVDDQPADVERDHLTIDDHLERQPEERECPVEGVAERLGVGEVTSEPSAVEKVVLPTMKNVNIRKPSAVTNVFSMTRSSNETVTSVPHSSLGTHRRRSLRNDRGRSGPAREPE